MLTATTAATTGILTNEVNVGFTPEGKYLTAGNDVVDLSEWTGSGNVTIGDAFSNDNDKVSVLAKPLSTGATGTGELKLTAVENLEIISFEPSSVILNGANFKGLEAIKLIGDGTTLSVSDFTYGIKVDATENADSISGGFKADTINGGAGNDTIQGNKGNDVLTGGNGADEFIVGNAGDFGIDQILDFSAEDKISMANFSAQELKKFDASTFSTVTYKTLDSVLATFAAGGANVTKPNDVVIFSYDGKTYALLSTGAGFKEANDALVDITGANVASLTESNFGGASITPTPTPGGDYNYENYPAFKADFDFDKITQDGVATIQTMTVAQAAELAPNYLTTTGKNALLKVADGGIKAITGDVITVDVGNTAKFDATKFDAKLDQSIIEAGTITMKINGNSGTGDTIAASVLGGIIDGSGGTSGAADTIKLNDGVDIVKFSTSDANKETDVINFGSEDKLIFGKTTFGNITWTSGSGFSTAFTSNKIAGNKVYYGDGITDEAVASLVNDSSSAKALAITTTGKIYYLSDDGNSAVTSTLVGSVTGVDLVATNVEFAS